MPDPSRSTAAITVPVRVRPGASRERVGGGYPGRFGPALVVAVPAPAVDGRANQAVVRVLARALGVPRSTIRIRTGTTGRDKLLTIADPPPGLADVIARLRDGE